MEKPRILFSMPTRHHVEIAFDEMQGLQELGYTCDSFPYAAREGVSSKLGRLRVIVENALALVKKARQFKPDVVYFNSRLEALAGARDFITIMLFKAMYRKRVHFVLKSHGSDLNVFDSSGFTVNKIILPYLKKNISGWLFLSSEECRIVSANHYLPEERIFITKNIVRTEQFRPDNTFRQQLSIPAEYKLLLFVGRLIAEKGIYEVVNAFAKINNYYKAKLIIVGWGSEEQSLNELCSNLGINNDVIFTGFMPEQKVVAYYANCDILVFPTYFPEGFPMSLFNSIAAGMPVITTRTRAAADYLTEPDNCLWVEPKDADNVASALKRMLDSETLTAAMKQNNLEKGKIFSKPSVCRELSETINLITAH